MPAQRRPPSARDRALGTQLRLIRRQQTNLSMEAAAKLLQWSLTSMSRMENGKRRISPEDVATILATYRVPIEQRNALVAKAKANDDPAWWSGDQPGLTKNAESLAGYEAEAHTITEWSITLIPGLLQTYEYARACILSGGKSPADFEERWAIRLRRQQRRPKFDYTAYIGESAIRTPFGGRSFIKQLKHLLDMTDRGVGIRIVPSHLPHVVIVHSWHLMEFSDSPPIVHAELMRSSVFLYAAEAEPYFELRATLARIALSAAESRDMLRSLIERAEGSRWPQDGASLPARET